MLRISIFLIAMVSLLIFSVSNATEVILEDTPNVATLLQLQLSHLVILQAQAT